VKPKYGPETEARIIEALAEGKSLRAVCSEPDMPKCQTVLEWLEKPERSLFAEQYARAREVGYKLLADEILAISDDGSNDTYTDENGVIRTNQEVVARSKLRVESRKWLLSKMLPKIYGDKLDLSVTDNTDPRTLTNEQLARIAAAGSAGASSAQASAGEPDSIH
jgi:hypothetical protein